MSHIKNLGFFFITFILLLPYVVNSQHVEKIRINPDAAMGGRFSDFFSEAKFIPLQSIDKNKNSQLGFVYQFAVNEKYYFFYDRNAEAILTFKKNGEFYSKISPSPIGKYISYFSLDRSKNLIYTLIDKKYIGIFDFEGNLIQKVDMVISKEFNVVSFFALNDNKFVANVSQPLNNEDKTGTYNRLLFVKDFNTIYRKQLPYSSKFGIQEDGGSVKPYLTKTDKQTVFYSPPNEYNIYEVSDTGIINQYNFVLPLQYSVPNKFSSDSIYRNKRMAFFDEKDNEKKVMRIGNVFRNKGWLFFSLETKKVNDNKQYMYHLQSGKLVAIQNIAPDNITFNLPIITPLGEVIGEEEDYIYVLAYSLFFHNYQRYIQDINVLPEYLKNYFSDKKNVQSNPVIIRLKVN